ncbi:MAG: thioredoxin family protein [Anaerolineae bacterium]
MVRRFVVRLLIAATLLALAGCGRLDPVPQAAQDDANIMVQTAASSAPPCLYLRVLYTTACGTCRYIKPVVARVAHEREGRVDAAMVLLDSPEGQTLKARFGVRGVPAVLLLNGEGQLVRPPILGVAEAVLLEKVGG